MSEKVWAKYVGLNPMLKDQTAILQRQDPTSRFVLFQFDNLQLPARFIYGWSLGAAKDFEVVKDV